MAKKIGGNKMNLFNSFQAMAFYTIMPFGIQYLFQNNYTGWGLYYLRPNL
jgi:hypothetical protein